MVSWKERGVVPDSDDEDDCESGGIRDDAHNDAVLECRKDGGESQDDSEVENGQAHDQDVSELLSSSRVVANAKPILNDSQLDTTTNDISPSSLYTFRAPINDLDLHELPQLKNSSPGPGLYADDEISKTYVELSSPLSSAPPSPAVSRTSETADTNTLRDFTNPENLSNSPSARRPWDTANIEGIESTHQDLDWPSTNRRALRQRNPIQLHPYALEGEKYRRTLMARGMRPLRLAPVQDRAKNEISDTASDLYLESQDENQSNIIAENPQPSQFTSDSVDQSQLIHCEDELPLAMEDEEFPDIDKLLNTRMDLLTRRSVKRRRITYTSRYISRHPPGLSTLDRPREHTEIISHTGRLNAPASPPATSSPIPTSNRPYVGADDWPAIAHHLSSRDHSLDDISPNGSSGSRTLPTPKTDTGKHVIDLTAEELNGEESSASESESIDISSSSEPDESVQVRTVGKKIRGVLPASWLRLDQHARQEEDVQASRRKDRYQSPERAPFRRGVAVPKDASNDNSPVAKRIRSDSYFLLDESEGDDDDDLPGFLAETAEDTVTTHDFTQVDEGSVYEDDRIDAMLPSQFRQTKLPLGGLRQRKERISTSLFTHSRLGQGHQPKITAHLVRPRTDKPKSHRRRQPEIRTNYPNSSATKTNPKGFHERHEKLAPRLSILDLVHLQEDSRERTPNFIRIAARTAKSRRELGRHSPTRKFIRLATREDTQDAQSILREWREGTIRPRAENLVYQRPTQHRQPLGEVSHNASQPSGDQGEMEVRDMRPTQISRTKPRMSISKPTKNPDVAHPTHRQSNPAAIQNRQRMPGERVQKARPLKAGTRPAQLETTATAYCSSHPSVAFVSTKKALDTLYRKSHKGSAVRGDVQLARFLDDDLGSIAAKSSSNGVQNAPKKISSTTNHSFNLPLRRQKRTPKRVDARAALYRQPSEPLVLDSLQVAETELPLCSEGKLLGLGRFGTVYTYHFDILPLNSGIFFHESTFIGSGGLSKALATASPQSFDLCQGHILHRLGEKQLRWGLWDDTVSSELGVCFDWINDQLGNPNLVFSDGDGGSLMECLSFIIKYVQDYLTFPDDFTRKKSLSRFTDVLQSFADRLDMQVSKRRPRNVADFRVPVEISVLGMVLVFQLLKVSQMSCLELEVINHFEVLQQRIARILISLLLAAGLETVRQLYDDLQYLSFREAGIKSDRYIVQAWVVAVHILRAARVSRGAFWDVVNQELIKIHGPEMTDARVLERIWYSMFSLLPLAEFDESGVIKTDLRLSLSFENWALPQMMAKKIFELYGSKSRQSPSFNDYCRALFNRCSFLMQTWGWRRHSSIVGTLFDFFASHKLAHLRNEEVYSSPNFLENLDQNPSLAVDPDDRCFHILLKIIAVSLKQMGSSEDLKGVRNLVTRVLPNHDRQYPKEQKILQRDLASLRNHHDLLCTLFWAAPSELRPSMSLIRELVDPENAHREANLINMRAWENLARFVLATTPTATAYLPLATWQLESFNKLLVQHKSVEKDVELQLRQLSAAQKQVLPQQTVLSTIHENKRQIVMAMVRQMDALKMMIEFSRDMDDAKLVFCDESCTVALTETLSYFDPRYDYDWPMVESALNIIQAYMGRLNTLVPASEASYTDSAIDSQEYGSDIFCDTDIVRIECTGELNGKIFIAVKNVIHVVLQSGTTIKASVMEKIVNTWALLAGTHIMTKIFVLADFVSETGSLNELRMDDPSGHVRHYAAYFLRRLSIVTGHRLDIHVPPVPLYLGE